VEEKIGDVGVWVIPARQKGVRKVKVKKLKKKWLVQKYKSIKV